MLEKIGAPGYETLSKPDQVVLDLMKEIMSSKSEPVYYEIGVGIGATTLPVAELLNNKGQMVLFSRQNDVVDLANDLSKRGFLNVDSRWGSPEKVYSGYHFELAKGFVGGLLPRFDLSYIDGGHVFHLDAPAACVLKELCNPGGYMIFDDWYWSMERSPTYNPSVRPSTLSEYDERQVSECHVQLVCKVVMDTDDRYELIGIRQGSAIYRRRVES